MFRCNTTFAIEFYYATTQHCILHKQTIVLKVIIVTRWSHYVPSFYDPKTSRCIHQMVN